MVMEIFVGVAVTLVCSFVALFAGRAMERSGKLRFRSSDWKFKYGHRDRWGSYLCNDDPSNAEGVDYECRIEVFNDTDRPSALNEFLVEFRSAREVLLSEKPYCVRYRTNEGAWVPKVRTGAESVNLPARAWTTMHLWGHLPNEHAADLQGRGELTAHFAARLPSGKRKRWRMADFEPKA